MVHKSIDQVKYNHMTVDELIDRLQMLRMMDPKCGQNNVVIPVQGGGFGSTPCVEVSGVYQGIDWDRGKLFLYPVNKLDRL